ncbi:MAG: energy-coupling factor ABC transporter permease [Caldilineaceae bacterium]
MTHLFLTGYLPPNSCIFPMGSSAHLYAIIGWVLAILTIAYALRQTRDQRERQIPLLGVLAAFIFAAQAINFPVAGGTSVTCLVVLWRPLCLVRGLPSWS